MGRVRNSSLWSNVVFKKEVIFHEFDFETSDLEFEVSKSSIWKHTTSCDKGVFSFIIISQLRRPIELKFSQVCYFMHMLRYTKWEDWSLTIETYMHPNCSEQQRFQHCPMSSLNQEATYISNNGNQLQTNNIIFI